MTKREREIERENQGIHGLLLQTTSIFAALRQTMPTDNGIQENGAIK